MNITDLSLEDRPREKFEAKGPGALSTAELLAILIGSGTSEENAVALMQRVMHSCDESLKALGKMSIKDLCKFKGVGPAKAITILAACELGNRRTLEEATQREQFSSSKHIYDYFKTKVSDLAFEESHVMLLNNNLRLIGTRLISRGGITGTVVDVRLVLKEALLAAATHIALCHNHPSGSLTPSREDDALTKRLHDAAVMVQIQLIDHLIISDFGYFSYRDEGKL